MDFLHRLLAADGLEVPGQDGIDGRGVRRRRRPPKDQGRTD